MKTINMIIGLVIACKTNLITATAFEICAGISADPLSIARRKTIDLIIYSSLIRPFLPKYYKTASPGIAGGAALGEATVREQGGRYLARA